MNPGVYAYLQPLELTTMAQDDDAFDWNTITGIKYLFLRHTIPKYQGVHTHLNEKLTDEISIEDMDDLFIQPPDTSEPTLVEDVVGTLKRIVVEHVASLVGETTYNNDLIKIRTLFDKTIIRTKNGDTNVSLRNKRHLIEAAKRTIEEGNSMIHLHFDIDQWHFNIQMWSAMNFEHVGLEQSIDTTSPGNTTTQGNQLSQAITTMTALLGRMNQNNPTQNQASQASNNPNIPQGTTGSPHTGIGLPWNPNSLPTQVKERYLKREGILTGSEMLPFNIATAGSPAPVKMIYYLDPPGIGPRLITRDGLCFDLTRNERSKEASRDKQFIANFPRMQGDAPEQIRKWYREVTAFALGHNIYVHPYYLFRKDAAHIRGFTVGTDTITEHHDLPTRFELAITEWGTLIYTALKSDKVIPESCPQQRQTILSYEGGKGYEALKAMINRTHPISARHPHDAIRDHPIQEKSESLEQYYFKYQDFLRLRAFLVDHKATMSDKAEVSTLIKGTLYCDKLRRKTDDERESSDQFKVDKYKEGRLLQTLQVYVEEIKQERERRTPKPSFIPSNLSKRGDRRSGRSSKSRTSLSSGSTTPSTLTNSSINLIDQLGEPKMPESDDAASIFAHSVYIHALRAIDGDAKKFDTLRPCLVCGEKGHSFDGCPMLNDIEYLRSHRIMVAGFLKRIEKSDENYVENAKISQISANHNEEEESYASDSSASSEQMDFLEGQR